MLQQEIYADISCHFYQEILVWFKEAVESGCMRTGEHRSELYTAPMCGNNTWMLMGTGGKDGMGCRGATEAEKERGTRVGVQSAQQAQPNSDLPSFLCHREEEVGSPSVGICTHNGGFRKEN